jgi:hypothetical protein
MQSRLKTFPLFAKDIYTPRNSAAYITSATLLAKNQLLVLARYIFSLLSHKLSRVMATVRDVLGLSRTWHHHVTLTSVHGEPRPGFRWLELFVNKDITVFFVYCCQLSLMNLSAAQETTRTYVARRKAEWCVQWRDWMEVSSYLCYL